MIDFDAFLDEYGTKILLLIVVLLFLPFHFGSPGIGEQAGVINEIENAGLVWKNIHVTVAPLQFSSGTKSTSYVYGTDPEIAATMVLGKEYHIFFKCYFAVPEWEYADNCVITGVYPL